MFLLIHVLLYKIIFQWVIQLSFLYLTAFLVVCSRSRFFTVYSIRSQIKVWNDFQNNFSSFTIKPEFCKDFLTKFEWNQVALYDCATPKPSLKKQAILTMFILQCFTIHPITFVYINGADVSSNGRTVNTK